MVRTINTDVITFSQGKGMIDTILMAGNSNGAAMAEALTR